MPSLLSSPYGDGEGLIFQEPHHPIQMMLNLLLPSCSQYFWPWFSFSNFFASFSLGYCLQLRSSEYGSPNYRQRTYILGARNDVGDLQTLKKLCTWVKVECPKAHVRSSITQCSLTQIRQGCKSTRLLSKRQHVSRFLLIINRFDLNVVKRMQLVYIPAQLKTCCPFLKWQSKDDTTTMLDTAMSVVSVPVR